MKKEDELNESINVVDFINARAKEIEAIEESIKVSRKKTMLFQRIPYYNRRRNRNYDKRTNIKKKHRKVDRHLLRSHTFYAKRFFMLKLARGSIPVDRRVKSSKYIYKSQERGFIFDESFRGISQYTKEELNRFCAQNNSDISEIDFTAQGSFFTVRNEYEILVDGDNATVIGRTMVPAENAADELVNSKTNTCFISVLLAKELVIPEKYECRIFRPSASCTNDYSLETHKVLCHRTKLMDVYEYLQNKGLIAIGLNEIHRIALERDAITIYDNVHSELYKEIEDAKNAEIIAKYNRTPLGKKNVFDTGKLCLSGDAFGEYALFTLIKGKCKTGAEIFAGDKVVGRVVRSEYKYSSAHNCGLAILASKEHLDNLQCKDLDQKILYDIKITKYF
ncbi:hypothetical protein ENBRE01_1871 [Enteropsectra breve]|nr:hypothetical protein ENBRE01_1871 [Enteropsectra breve]